MQSKTLHASSPYVDETHRILAFRATLVTATLFLALFVLQIAAGTNPQLLEHVTDPESYTRTLLSTPLMFRWVLVIDAAFIAAYSFTTLLLVTVLAARGWGALHFAVVLLVGVVTLLDYQENHHLLALLEAAESGVAIPLSELSERATWSGVKWLLGHMAFVGVGLILPVRSGSERLLALALVFVQLPLGAAARVLPVGPLASSVELLRNVNLLVGFLWLSFYLRRPAAVDVSG